MSIKEAWNLSGMAGALQRFAGKLPAGLQRFATPNALGALGGAAAGALGGLATSNRDPRTGESTPGLTGSHLMNAALGGLAGYGGMRFLRRPAPLQQSLNLPPMPASGVASPVAGLLPAAPQQLSLKLSFLQHLTPTQWDELYQRPEIQQLQAQAGGNADAPDITREVLIAALRQHGAPEFGVPPQAPAAGA